MKCETCGMMVKLGEYHPHAACLMYKACDDAEYVRATISDMRKHWIALGYRQAIHAVKEKLGEAF